MQPSTVPSSEPTRQPSNAPSKQPSGQPSQQPVGVPTDNPTIIEAPFTPLIVNGENVLRDVTQVSTVELSPAAQAAFIESLSDETQIDTMFIHITSTSVLPSTDSSSVATKMAMSKFLRNRLNSSRNLQVEKQLNFNVEWGIQCTLQDTLYQEVSKAFTSIKTEITVAIDDGTFIQSLINKEPTAYFYSGIERGTFAITTQLPTSIPTVFPSAPTQSPTVFFSVQAKIFRENAVVISISCFIWFIIVSIGVYYYMTSVAKFRKDEYVAGQIFFSKDRQIQIQGQEDRQISKKELNDITEHTLDDIYTDKNSNVEYENVWKQKISSHTPDVSTKRNQRTIANNLQNSSRGKFKGIRGMTKMNDRGSL